MMTIKCPKCGVPMRVEEKYVGKRGRCNKCGEIIVVAAPPTAAATEPSAPPPPEATAPAPASKPRIVEAVRARALNPFDRPAEPDLHDEAPGETQEQDAASLSAMLARVSVTVPPRADQPATAEAENAEPTPEATGNDDPFGAEGDNSDDLHDAPSAADSTLSFLLPAAVTKTSAAESRPAASEPPRPRVVAVPPEPAPMSNPFEKATAAPPAMEAEPAPVAESATERPLANAAAATTPIANPFNAWDERRETNSEPVRAKTENDNVGARANAGPAIPVATTPTIPTSLKTPMAQAGEPVGTPPKRRSPVTDLRIEALEVFLVRVPCHATLHGSAGAPIKAGKPTPRMLVKAVGSNGIIGWSEIAPCPLWGDETPEAVTTTIRKHLRTAAVGHRAWNLDGLVRRLDKAINPNAGGQTWAKAAIEQAVLDLVSRSLEVPLYVLLGGKRGKEIPLAWTVAATNADEAVEQAKKGVDQQYRALSLHLIGGNLTADLATVDRVAAIVPKDVPLALVVDPGYPRDLAQQLVQHLSRWHVAAVRRPLKTASVAGYRQLAAPGICSIEVDGPIANTVELVEYHTHDALGAPVLRIGRCGGLRATLRLAQTAEALGLRPVLGLQAETDLGLAHALQLFAAAGIETPLNLVGRQFVEAPFVGAPLAISGGLVHLPDAPGCGVTIKEPVLQEMLAER